MNDPRLDQQATVLEPFEQLEPIRHKHTPGVGLGPALVKEMVAAIGGCVDLKSELGVVTSFTVVLAPSAPQAARASA
jgi:signal transduction histidine kinase